MIATGIDTFASKTALILELGTTNTIKINNTVINKAVIKSIFFLLDIIPLSVYIITFFYIKSIL